MTNIVKVIRKGEQAMQQAVTGFGDPGVPGPGPEDDDGDDDEDEREPSTPQEAEEDAP